MFIIHGSEDADIRINHANDLISNAKKHYTPFFLEVIGAGHNDIEHDEKHRKNYFIKLREFT